MVDYMPPSADADGQRWVRTGAVIQASAEDLYARWRDVERSTEWRGQTMNVRKTGDKTSHWTMEVGDRTLEWNSEILADEPGKRIAWRSTGGDLNEAGEVIFEPAPGNRGTMVTVLQEFQMGAVENLRQTDPVLLNPHDAIIKVTRTAICGSDLHLYDGFIPTMEEGDILGHEFMGIVEETGSEVTNLKRGDRVVVPFTIACGQCLFCKKQIWAACDNTNPNAHLMEKLYGYSGSGLFGYSHMMGGYAGGQAQYVRVPFANVGPLKIQSDLPDEKVLFLSDIFPTGYMAAENAQIAEGDTVAVWGCGPVGIFAIESAFMFGAARVIAIDRFPERLELARKRGAITVDYSEEDVSVLAALKDLTGGVGPDACIDAVGLEAHFNDLQGAYDKVKTALMLEQDRPGVLRQAIQAIRKGGTVSIPGVYGGMLDKVPFGAAFGKGITMKMGQTNMHRYMKPLLERIQKNEIDPSSIISHRITIDEAPEMYKVWRDKEQSVTKIVIDPWADKAA